MKDSVLCRPALHTICMVTGRNHKARMRRAAYTINVGACGTRFYCFCWGRRLFASLDRAVRTARLYQRCKYAMRGHVSRHVPARLLPAGNTARILSLVKNIIPRQNLPRKSCHHSPKLPRKSCHTNQKLPRKS